MITQNNYGKSRVRLVKVDRRSQVQEFQNLSVDITFEGDFEEVYTKGDNSKVLPTDTMKNTVYVLASQKAGIEPIEKFGMRLADHFLSENPQVSNVRIDIWERGWSRILIDGKPHDHSFTRDGNERRTTSISATRDGVEIKAGIEDLVVLKTTRSGFAGFLKDKYTTLPETNERIFATSIKAVWSYGKPQSATSETWRAARQTILEVFAQHDSLSVQHTLDAMGEAVLERHPDIGEIFLSLPNIHCIPVDMERFGLENDGRIFVPTDEPFGVIEARLAR